MRQLCGFQRPGGGLHGVWHTLSSSSFSSSGHGFSRLSVFASVPPNVFFICSMAGVFSLASAFSQVTKRVLFFGCLSASFPVRSCFSSRSRLFYSFGSALSIFPDFRFLTPNVLFFLRLPLTHRKPTTACPQAGQCGEAGRWTLGLVLPAVCYPFNLVYCIAPCSPQL